MTIADLTNCEDLFRPAVVIHLRCYRRYPEELKKADDADAHTDEDPSDITAYARVGDSKIIYLLSGSDYEALMAANYDDLRHQEIFSGDFSELTGIDVTLDGKSYTLTTQKDGKKQKWLYQDEGIETDDLQDALENLTAEEFTSKKAMGQQEINLTLYLDNEDYSEITITLYRYDGAQCLAVVDGKSVAYIPRSEAVELMEAIRAIVL